MKSLTIATGHDVFGVPHQHSACMARGNPLLSPPPLTSVHMHLSMVIVFNNCKDVHTHDQLPGGTKSGMRLLYSSAIKEAKHYLPSSEETERL